MAVISLRPRTEGWVMLAPALAVYLLFAGYPMFDVVVMSFSKWNGLTPDAPFVGFDNYRFVLTSDPVFWGAFVNTLLWTVLALIIPNLISFGLALALNQALPGRSSLRVVFYLPVIIASIAVATIWKWMYDPFFGLFNSLLTGWGFQAWDWLGDRKIALWSVFAAHDLGRRQGMTPMTATTHVYDIFEKRLTGPATGNPYLEVDLSATFRQGNRRVPVTGFHDGGSDYVFRFMPDRVGEWAWETTSNVTELNGKSGSFTATPARPGAHGPVRVRDSFHFAHDDGTPYLPFGTTCYAWTHQPLAMQKETLETLAETGFNKIRMGVFPKDYPFNQNDPLQDIFLRGPDGALDFDRPNPAAFRHFETQVSRLAEMGIEADIIMFHPYDRWGYATMTPAQNFAYTKYLAARLSAHRNVWWALANEYDFLLDTIPISDWDHIFHLLEEHDPVGHLRSIHNGDQRMNFDHRKPWVSHVCIQNWDVKRTPEWRAEYGKPVVNDEPEYEGDIIPCWGNITAEELVHRFWLTIMRGGYAGHGETYSDPDDLIWWAKGGKLHGQAWQRIAFLRKLMEAAGTRGLEPMGHNDEWPWSRVSGARDIGGRVSWIYLGEHKPDQWTTGLPQDGGSYQVDLIDTWQMTVTPAEIIPPYIPYPQRHGEVIRGGKADADFGVRLPSRPRLALRIIKL